MNAGEGAGVRAKYRVPHSMSPSPGLIDIVSRTQ